jgi:hypothetical protein
MSIYCDRVTTLVIMADDKDEPDVEELPENACWSLLRTTSVGRLAVLIDDHPDIFPLNFAVDHGTVVFRSRTGTKVSAALSDLPVALEADGYDAEAARAWSVVIRGNAEQIHGFQELMDTVDLPLFPWQAGEKGQFIRIIPTIISGRRFPVVDSSVWRTPLSDLRRTSID